jgi:hypothetical protein
MRRFFHDAARWKANPARRCDVPSLAGDSHIHGRLAIEVNGISLPHLHHFDPGDVCVGEWVFQLQCALRSLKGSAQSRFIHDEGEQGQPAFLFEREGDRVFVSIVASVLSGGDADPG